MRSEEFYLTTGRWISSKKLFFESNLKINKKKGRNGWKRRTRKIRIDGK